MEIFLLVLIVLLAAFTAGTTYWVFHKAKQMHRLLAVGATRQDLDDLYRQIESLDALHRDLGFARSLPPLRGFAGSPDFLRTVSNQVQKQTPAHVLELGSGSSTLIIAKALQRCGCGHVTSLDHEAGYAEATRQLIKAHGLDAFVTVIHAPLVTRSVSGRPFRWYSLDQLPPHSFDLLVVDGPPTSTQPLARYPALPELVAHLSLDCVVIADDTARRDETVMLQRWRDEFKDFVQSSVPCEKGCVVLQRESSAVPDAAFAR